MRLETSIQGPVAVIGDIHGQVEQLTGILEQLRRLPDYDRRWILFIGDLVDRGPDPKGAIDLVLDLLIEHPRTTAIAGNHELAMAAALGLVPVPEYSDWAGRWADHYGSESTFSSYGVDFGDFGGLLDNVPDGHRVYLSDLPWCVEHPDYFFVHAGLDPNLAFAMQRDILRARDFTLNRPQWLCSKRLPYEAPPDDCPYTVVSGHVKVPEVTYSRQRILIDTTGGEGGALSCVLLPENKLIQFGEPKPVERPQTVPVKKKSWFW